MVYMVRTVDILDFEADLQEQMGKLVEHFSKSYPQIKGIKFLMNITGPINQTHMVLKFESLADEETWATSVITDDVYLDFLKASKGVTTPGVDHLYREFSM